MCATISNLFKRPRYDVLNTSAAVSTGRWWSRTVVSSSSCPAPLQILTTFNWSYPVIYLNYCRWSGFYKDVVSLRFLQNSSTTDYCPVVLRRASGAGKTARCYHWYFTVSSKSGKPGLYQIRGAKTRNNVNFLRQTNPYSCQSLFYKSIKSNFVYRERS